MSLFSEMRCMKKQATREAFTLAITSARAMLAPTLMSR